MPSRRLVVTMSLDLQLRLFLVSEALLHSESIICIDLEYMVHYMCRVVDPRRSGRRYYRGSQENMKDEITRVVGEAEGAKAAVDNEDEAPTL